MASAAAALERAAAVVPSVCPSDNAATKSAVLSFLTSPAFADDRQQFEMGTVDTSQVRLLVDSTDSAVCQHFVDTVELPSGTPRIWAFYKAGSFYFIASQNTSPTLKAPDPLLVFNSSLTFLGSFGM
ncbi:MAG: hypothetical protein ACREON_14180 [Gemmatimonadaceae bacterium]